MYFSDLQDTVSKIRVNNLIIYIVCVCHFSRVWFCVIPWTEEPGGLQSMGFSRQESWSGLPCPPPGDLHDPGIEHASLTFPALIDGFFTTNATWKAQHWLWGGQSSVRTGMQKPLFALVKEKKKKKNVFSKGKHFCKDFALMCGGRFSFPLLMPAPQ